MLQDQNYHIFSMGRLSDSITIFTSKKCLSMNSCKNVIKNAYCIFSHVPAYVTTNIIIKCLIMFLLQRKPIKKHGLQLLYVQYDKKLSFQVT